MDYQMYFRNCISSDNNFVVFRTTQPKMYLNICLHSRDVETLLSNHDNDEGTEQNESKQEDTLPMVAQRSHFEDMLMCLRVEIGIKYKKKKLKIAR